MSEKILFVTGRLAEHALRVTLSELASASGFEYHIQVLPITVAALMTPRWIAARLEIPEGTTRIVIPGYCDGDLEPLREATGLPLVVGPKDLRDLPHLFDQQKKPPDLTPLVDRNHCRDQLRSPVTSGWYNRNGPLVG